MKRRAEYGRWFTVYGWIAVMILTLLLININLFAQSERKLVREGNKLYEQKKYSDAEVKYKKSLNSNKESGTAQFNLGDAYYKQEKYDEAVNQFQSVAADKRLSKEKQARAFHNLGNSYLKNKKYDESIKSYQNSLKLNPKDNDTRYNLAYAKAMLQQQQQQQKQDNQDKDQKDKDQQKQDQQNQQDQKKDQQNKEEQKQAQAQKKQGISKEDAEKMLQALNNDEKNTQKKLVKKEAVRVSIEKQW